MKPVWRLIETPPAPGAWNMAADVALLAGVAAGGPPVLRLYGFHPPALSLGYFQKAKGTVDWTACRTAGVDVVRRPTGGRAVLHEHEVTYALCLPERYPGLPGSVAESYRFLIRFIVRALRALGGDARLTPAALPGERRSGRSPTDSRAACFAAPSWYEVAVGGRKVVGSAQVRRHGALLQHGSLLLRFDAERLASLFAFPDGEARAAAARQLAGSACGLADCCDAAEFSAVAAALVEAFAAEMDARLAPDDLTAAERALAEQTTSERQVSAG